MEDHHSETAEGSPETGSARRRPPLGRLLGDSFGELNGVLRVLPELASHLRSIRHSTESMAAEVRGMHSSVRRIELQVGELRGQVEHLETRVSGVEAGMDRLEPHIADVNLAMRPLRRARARLPQRAPVTPSLDPPVPTEVSEDSGA